MQDKEIVALFKEGSQKAFEVLYARYKRQLLYLGKRALKNETDLEDMVQDIFVQLWETRDSLNPELSFSGYVFTLMRNRILYRYRHFDVHSRFAQHILINAEDSTNETEDTIIENDFTVLLNGVIENLPPMQKEIFLLSRKEGLTYKEISEMLQISVPAIQKHVSISLKKIKEHLKLHADIHFQAIMPFLIFFS
jgi:RNA polymerase sigma-70 factor (ECF subfamily)